MENNIIRITAFFWLVAKIISYKVWLADRVFPLAPVSGLHVPAGIHAALFILSLIGLALLLVWPHKKSLLISLIVIEILSCTLDQNRWQPWEYQYILTLFVFLIQKNKEHAKAVFIFILASTYIYSGIAKINPVFLQSIWQNMILLRQFHLPLAVIQQPLVYHAGYLLGLSEILLGIGLLMRSIRKIAAWLIIIMHLILLAAFGPWGLNYDHIIWPWNLAMIGYCIVFIRSDRFIFSYASLTAGWGKAVIILVGVLPILGLFGKWDYFLSASFFSSRPPDMYLCVAGDSTINPFQKYCRTNTRICDASACAVNVRSWAFDELMVPAYPQQRIYQDIKDEIGRKYPDLHATYLMFEYKDGTKIPREF
jgi:hypothetical protein